MTQLRVAFLLLAVVYLVCQSAITINAIPVDNDSAELIMKIEKVNERLPAALAKQKNDSSIVTDEKPKKKSQRNYPVHYVNTQVNGKFGKSVRALTSMELSNSELAEVAKWR